MHHPSIPYKSSVLTVLALAAACILLSVAIASTDSPPPPPAPGDSAARPQESVEIKVTSRLSGDRSIPIAALAGDRFVITLASNATTGFKWRLANTLDDKILKLVGSAYKAPEEPIPGRGGTESWTFQALAKGKAIIVLEYARPWEKDTEPAKKQAFAVTIQ